MNLLEILKDIGARYPREKWEEMLNVRIKDREFYVCAFIIENGVKRILAPTHVIATSVELIESEIFTYPILKSLSKVNARGKVLKEQILFTHFNLSERWRIEKSSLLSYGSEEEAWSVFKSLSSEFFEKNLLIPGKFNESGSIKNSILKMYNRMGEDEVQNRDNEYIYYASFNYSRPLQAAYGLSSSYLNGSVKPSIFKIDYSNRFSFFRNNDNTFTLKSLRGNNSKILGIRNKDENEEFIKSAMFKTFEEAAGFYNYHAKKFISEFCDLCRAGDKIVLTPN